MLEKPAFIQGVFEFRGAGLGRAGSFQPPVTYQVPADKHAQAIYFRAGNASGEMIYLVLTSDGKPMQYFPVGAKGAMHVPLVLLENIPPGSKVEILVAAPSQVNSTVLLDIGFMEMEKLA